jgi:hypothetical protein
MFRWLPCRSRQRQTTDPNVKRAVESAQQELKHRIQASVGRDIQEEIDAIRRQYDLEARHGH